MAPLHPLPVPRRFLAAFLMVLAAVVCVSVVHGWQPVVVSRVVRSKLLCLNLQQHTISKICQQEQRQKSRGGLFTSSSSSSHRRRGLALRLEKINGSSDDKTNGSTATLDELTTNDGGRRSRLRSAVSNIWSTFRKKDTHTNHALETSGTMVQVNPEEIVEELETENRLLRETIRQLESENDRLVSQRRVVIENFEGEGRYNSKTYLDTNNEIDSYGSGGFGEDDDDDWSKYGITLTGEELVGDASAFASTTSQEAALWCDELEEDACPVEPTVSFGQALRDRAYWLVGLLAMQSMSGIILAKNEALLANHPVIIYFLTMLVGAGGNAGNQASVRGMYMYPCSFVFFPSLFALFFHAIYST